MEVSLGSWTDSFWPKERLIFVLRAIWIAEEAAKYRQGGPRNGGGETSYLHHWDVL